MNGSARGLIGRLWRTPALAPLRGVVRALALRDVQYAEGLDRLRLEKRRLVREIRGHTERVRGYAAVTGVDLEDYFAQVERNYAPFANPFDYYRWLVDSLLDMDRAELLPLVDLFEPGDPTRPRIGLRHDVDADPRAALRCARFLARRGVGGSFYLLHTAPYYGAFHDGLFVRNAELARWVRGLVVAGCEIGLHNDALGAELIHGSDGPDAVRTEIEWLREQGARVVGTVAHNSAPVYGAENYEVFEGRVLFVRSGAAAAWPRLPLGRLSEAELGLAYEGTFARPRSSVDLPAAEAFCRDRASADIRGESWMRRYLLENPICEWTVDLQFWLTGIDRWVIGGRMAGREVFEWEVSAVRVFEVVRELPPSARALFVLHPEYFAS